jgi:Flp pilus assembly protein TadD
MVGTRLEQRGAVAAYPVWTFVEMVWRSFGLWVVPWPLGLDHPLTFVDTFDGGFAAVLAAGTIVAAGLTAWAWRRLPMAAWCAVWAVSGFLPLAPLPWNTVKGLLQENRAAFSAVALAWLTAAAARGLVALTRRVAPRVPAPALLGVGLLLVAGAVSMDRDRARVWGDEVRLWEEAARLSPKSRGAQVNLGGAYLARLDFDRAEAAYRRALALTPDQALPYYALGMLAYRRGQDDEAVAWLTKTASLAPDYAKTYRMLGVLAIRQGRDADARSSLRRALALDPRDATAMAHLGLVAQRAGDDAAAERWFLDAIALDPAQPLARNNLGTLYLARRRWAEALDQFSALLVHAPNDYDAALNRSVALDALGRKAEARAAIQALLARLPADPRYDQHRRSASFILSRSRP